ncbi:hypothetical protein BH23GEM3_BH23GEM3_11310 [soil metagenome]
MERVTHSLCTLEFDNNRAVYDWVVERWQGFVRSRGETPAHPRQYEFARGNLDYTVVSKRKLLELVKGGLVSGWDDPRMPTLAGLRRRGVTPGAIRSFWERMGVAKFNSRVDIGKLEYATRDNLNPQVPRVLCVLKPLRLVITNYPEEKVEELDAPYYPHDVPKEGSRALPFSRALYIDRDDFRLDPPKGYFRLAPGREVRLRYAYLITCTDVVRDEAGEIVEVHCTYDPATRGGTAPDGRTVRGTIHWVSAEHALPCTVRLYDRLFSVPNPDEGEEDFKTHLNPDSLVTLDSAFIEPSVANDPPGSRYQFERQGYFCSDIVDSRAGALVFNRTVTLRDSWARIAQSAGAGSRVDEAPRQKKRAPAGEDAGRGTPVKKPSTDASGAGASGITRTPELESRRARYADELGLSAEEADILTREMATAVLFEAALATDASARGAANWIIHELPREIGGRTLDNVPFSGAELGALVALVEDGTLSSSAGREVLAEMAETGGDPAQIVDRRGLRQVSDPAALLPIIEDVLAGNAAKAEDYRNGKHGLLGFFMGQVMRRTKGAAHPEVVKELLEQRLHASA